MGGIHGKPWAAGQLRADPKAAGPKDIVDEAIQFFRSNVLFRNFEVKGPCDRTLIYLTLFISATLRSFEPCKTRTDAATKAVPRLLGTHFILPGEIGFPLNALYPPATERSEMEALRAFLRAAREQVCQRMLDRCFDAQTGMPNKWW